MYVPQHFAMDDDAVQGLLREHGAGDLVTATAQGLVATMLPFIHDPDRGPHGALLGHVARNNDHWRHAPVGEALVILRGPDAYISPQWYASKREHGRVVPTWNYVTAHVYGQLVVHDDVEWLDDLVRRLTEKHEAGRPQPWAVDDAPPRFVAGQLRAIVGLELRDQPDRGEGQAEPEPAGRRHRRRRRGRPAARRRGDEPRGRRGAADAQSQVTA